jgi:hypothetical protein
MRVAKQAAGGKARLDCSGVLFLRSLCRLTHVGHAQYYKGMSPKPYAIPSIPLPNFPHNVTRNMKGDGQAFQDFLEEHYPGLTNACVDRAEHSKRQDWALEASHDILPLLPALLDYTVRTLLDQSNVLRDSVLILAECVHFEAYVHVCSIMWRVAFKELRGLTNSKGLELNPLELNELYEYLYDLGTTLQGETCLRIFEDGFRPWPSHVFKDKGRSKNFHAAVDRNLTVRETRARYKPVLLSRATHG